MFPVFSVAEVLSRGRLAPVPSIPQGDLEDLLGREVRATSVWHAISFGSLNAALGPGRK